MPMRSLAPIFLQANIWSQLLMMRKNARLAQSLLIIAPAALYLDTFLDYLLTHLLCHAEQPPCGKCAMCSKILTDNHPDVYQIKPETMGGTIKIEQIREMQMVAYQTPQLSEHKVVVIYPAEAMNQAAASALLKILEEPAPSTLFVLITTNADLLLPTIISRCQQLHVATHKLNPDLLRQGEAYAENAPRALLTAQRLDFLANLDALLMQRLTISDLAQKWSDQAPEEMLWFFSCVLSKLIQINVLPHASLEPEYQTCYIFKQSWHPVNLYEQLDNIYAILKLLHSHINLNTTLMWERIFIDFMQGSQVPC